MSEMPDIQPSQRAVLSWYMMGQSLWFVAMGIQFIAFQAIGALVLNLSGTQLGIAQSALLLPTLLFMLPAGVAAERNDGRLLLIRLQLAAVLPPFVLSIMVLTQQLDFTGLIIYAMVMGVIFSFVMPTRDALISRIVAPHEIQRAVTIAIGLQFVGQVIGMAFVGLSAFQIGWMPMCQALALVLAAFVTHRLPYQLMPSASQQTYDSSTHRTAQIMDGLRLAFRHREIAPVIILTFFISMFYMGTFFVFFPLIVRDYYQGDASDLGDLAIINILFFAGMVFSAFALLRAKRVQHLGRLLVFAAITGLTVLILLSIPGVFWWVAGLCFIWGCGGGVFMSASRTIVQSRAPESHRGRLLSIYQLAFLGGAPIGALMFGALIDIINNLHAAPLVPMIGMFVVLSGTIFFTRLWSIKLDEAPQVEQPI